QRRYFPIFATRTKRRAEQLSVPHGVIDDGFLLAVINALKLLYKWQGHPDPRNEMNDFWAKRQLRKNGTPYAVHPLTAAYLLRSIAGVMNPRVLIAEILHDVLEDGPMNAWLLIQALLETLRNDTLP